MQDAIKAAVQLVNWHLGLDINSSVVPYIVIVTTVSGFAFSFYRRIRDLKVISGKMQLATTEITGHTRKEIDSLLSNFRQLNDDLKGTVGNKIDELRVFLTPTDAVEITQSDPEIEAEAVKGMSKKTRLALATQARDMVVKQWLEGRSLKPSGDDLNVYEFLGKNPGDQKFKLRFFTPYRSTAESDGRLPFALDLWVDDYKKLNFEWDTEGKYSLRGFTRGNWFEDVALWNLVPTPLAKEARKVA